MELCSITDIHTNQNHNDTEKKANSYRRRTIWYWNSRCKLPEFYVPDIGMMGDTDVDIEDDTGLFDVLGTDDNNAQQIHETANLSHAIWMCKIWKCRAIGARSENNSRIRIDTFVSGSFVFGDFIEAFLRINNCKTVRHDYMHSQS